MACAGDRSSKELNYGAVAWASRPMGLCDMDIPAHGHGWHGPPGPWARVAWASLPLSTGWKPVTRVTWAGRPKPLGFMGREAHATRVHGPGGPMPHRPMPLSHCESVRASTPG
jgi:hypothetical protein